MTIKGTGGGTFQLEAGSCIGSKAPSGKLVLTAENTGTAKAGVIITFDGAGNVSALVTTGDADTANAIVWSGTAPIGATAARTKDAITLTDMPVNQLLGAKGTISATLKCEGTDGLL
ncbi:hypothetical protein ACFQ6N_19240 [Kitasatospora sp. NPDC056446]|uniref:hypothetical protein n=1 Tax=Kitasatospora sp. NPDC056446 TaxID=3345819 RepID=UPI0036A8E236